ncbi:CBO0543 family protein [Metabacillus fastidiosus]|uniref:CBO0543 family protein n=1 Tax=Metabacillus fastidiosus TaxID=1458 RepID=UPI002DBE116F|nr:CBO0543 family protein [Metabacillus fastidiosus]
MFLILVVAVYIILAYFFVDWKNWKSYYPTVQYYIICNLLYNFIFYNHSLWKYRAITVDWLNHTIIDITFTLIIIPVLIMIYLRYYPKRKKQYVYIIIWIAFFTIIEYFFYKKELFIYENGWNIFWSCVFNLILFTVIRIHYINPLKAFLVSLPIIIILLCIFHPSLAELK